MNAVPGNKEIEKYEIWKHEIKEIKYECNSWNKNFNLDLETSLNIHLNFDIEDIYNFRKAVYDHS